MGKQRSKSGVGSRKGWSNRMRNWYSDMSRHFGPGVAFGPPNATAMRLNDRTRMERARFITRKARNITHLKDAEGRHVRHSSGRTIGWNNAFDHPEQIREQIITANHSLRSPTNRTRGTYRLEDNLINRVMDFVGNRSTIAHNIARGELIRNNVMQQRIHETLPVTTGATSSQSSDASMMSAVARLNRGGSAGGGPGYNELR